MEKNYNIIKEKFLSNITTPLHCSLEALTMDFSMQNGLNIEQFIDLTISLNDQIIFCDAKGLDAEHCDIYKYLDKALIYNKKTRTIGLSNYRKIDLSLSELSLLNFYTERNIRIITKSPLISAQELYDNKDDFIFLSNNVSLNIETLSAAEKIINEIKEIAPLQQEDGEKFITINKSDYKKGIINLGETEDDIKELQKEHFILTSYELSKNIHYMKKIKIEFNSFLIDKIVKSNLFNTIILSFYEKSKPRVLSNNKCDYYKIFEELMNNLGIENSSEEQDYSFQNQKEQIVKLNRMKLLNIYKSLKNNYFLSDEDYNKLKLEIKKFLNDTTLKKMIYINKKTQQIIFSSKRINLLKKIALKDLSESDYVKGEYWSNANNLYSSLNNIQKESMKIELKQNSNSYQDEINDMVRLSSYFEITEKNKKVFKILINTAIDKESKELMDIYYMDNANNSSKDFGILHIGYQSQSPLYLFDCKVGFYTYLPLYSFVKEVLEKLNIKINTNELNKALFEISMNGNGRVSSYGTSEILSRLPSMLGYLDGPLIDIGKNKSRKDSLDIFKGTI